VLALVANVFGGVGSITTECIFPAEGARTGANLNVRFLLVNIKTSCRSGQRVRPLSECPLGARVQIPVSACRVRCRSLFLHRYMPLLISASVSASSDDSRDVRVSALISASSEAAPVSASSDASPHFCSMLRSTPSSNLFDSTL
jgi:hypothetical protein